MAGNDRKPNPLADLASGGGGDMAAWVARKRAGDPVPSPPHAAPPAPPAALAPPAMPETFDIDPGGPTSPLAAVEGMGDRVAIDLAAALALGDWKETQGHFDRVASSDERTFYLEILADASGPAIAGWSSARGDTPIPYLLRGRSVLSASSRADVAAARTLLGAAEADFVRAFTIRPEDAHAYAYLAAAGAARGLPRETIEKRLEAAVRCDPENRPAHRARIRLEGPAGGGTGEAALAAAREAAKRAREGSGTALLVVEGHLVAWSSRAPLDLSYFRDPKILAEIRRARAKSIGHPAWKETPYAAVDRNALAFILFLAGEREAARAEFAAIGERISAWPWCLWGDPAAAFREARAKIVDSPAD